MHHVFVVVQEHYAYWPCAVYDEDHEQAARSAIDAINAEHGTDDWAEVWRFELNPADPARYMSTRVYPTEGQER